MGNDKNNLELPLPLNGHKHAHLNGDFANTLWKGIPALSWSMNLEDGQLQVRGTHPAANVTTAPIDALGRLLRAKVAEQGPEPTQFLGMLPALDGVLHHFLIIGFPVGPTNGTQQRHMAGTAVDVTQHNLRLDELAHQALVDELTGLYNLRGFLLFAEHELKAARRRKTLSAVIYVDVDGLKTVNDTRGHSQGDALLLTATKLLRKVFRECDVIGRLNGDEFVIFASDVKGDPEVLVTRLRLEVPMAASSSGLGVSIGVAWCEPDSRMSLADLVAAADRGMYRDKSCRDRLPAEVPAAAGPRGTSI